MDEKTANQMVNLLESIEKKLTRIVNALAEKKKK